jgi:tetratricopeptide (TPR) repeat protein
MQHKELLPILASILLVMALALLMSLQPESLPVSDALRILQTPASPLSTRQVENKTRAIHQLLDWQPWRVELWEQLGDAELAVHKDDQAVAAYEQALRAGSLSSQGKMHLGDLYQQFGRPADAEHLWLELVTSGDHSKDVIERLAHAQRRKGDFEAAVSTLQTGLAADPQNSQAAFELGLLLLGSKPEEALSWMEKAAQVDPALEIQVLPFKEAVRKISQANPTTPKEIILGRALARHGDWELAADIFQKATQLLPENAEAWALLGEARQQTGGDGQVELGRAQQINPQSILVQVLTALKYRRDGKPDLALPYLEAVIQAEPQQAQWRFELGNTLSQMGELNDALITYQKATQLEAGNPFYWRALAHFSIANDVEARQTGLPAARQALLLAPEDATYQDLMGWALLSLGDLNSAERFLQRAVTSDPLLADGYLHLGQLYIQNGDQGQAFINLSKARKLDGGKSETGRIAERLINQYFNRGS